jgi:hypothetical protein
MRGETIATAASKAKSNQYSGIMQCRSRKVVRLWPLYKKSEMEAKVVYIYI